MDGAFKVVTEKRDSGFFLIVKPTPTLAEKGWSPVEKGPYETEEVVNEEAQRFAKTVQSVFPSPNDD